MIKKVSLLTLPLLFLPVLPVLAEGNDPDPELEPLIIDGNVELCRFIGERYIYFDAEQCIAEKGSGDEIVLDAAFVTPRNRQTIIKNVHLRLVGYNARMHLTTNPNIVIENSIISNAHGCLFSITESSEQHLKIISGTFSSGSTSEDEGVNYVPSPFCVETEDAEKSLRLILAEGSEYYLADSKTILSELLPGVDSRPKISGAPVQYLASSTVVVKNTTTSTESPSELDPGDSDPDSVSEAEPIIPKAPDTGIPAQKR